MPDPFFKKLTVIGAQGVIGAKDFQMLDQALVAGIGNIYASEALFRAGIDPRCRARRLSGRRVATLRDGVRRVLAEAIRRGSSITVNWSGPDRGDGLFYFGADPAAGSNDEERWDVYDRAGLPCRRCGAQIRRVVQSARSTFYCPHCQR